MRHGRHRRADEPTDHEWPTHDPDNPSPSTTTTQPIPRINTGMERNIRAWLNALPSNVNQEEQP